MLGMFTPILSVITFRELNKKELTHAKAAGVAALFTLAGYSFLKTIKTSFLIFGPLHAFPTLIALSIAFAASCAYQIPSSNPTTNGPKGQFPTWCAAAGLACLASWCSLFQLPNWGHFSASCVRHPFPAIIIFTLCLIASIFFVSGNPGVSRLYERISFTIPNRLKKPLWFCAGITFLFGIILLSFRFDTFFQGSSEMHWEYYTGPIRGIRNGGWLLWDIPSQYGFLNILSAALIPTRTSWQALYLLQGVLLIPAALILFWILANGSIKRNALFAAALTLSALFFADPELIGPYLYPSSSVMRFFWCYAILFFLLRFKINEKLPLNTFVACGSVLWVLGSLWSIESFIYCSCTFIPALIFAVVQNQRGRFEQSTGILHVIRKTAAYLSIPTFMLAGALALISGFYALKAGHLPDWRVFLEHAISYAGGFGSVAMAPAGSVWILLLLFCGILTVILRMALNNFQEPYLVPSVGALGCLWGISSYFIGRAVPNNITAILPILTLIIGVLFYSIARSETEGAGILLKIISIPLFTLILTTGLGNVNFPRKISTFSSLSSDITDRVRPADADLQVLLDQAGITHEDSVVFDGGSAAMPRWYANGRLDVGEKTWLPNPVQLLEEPVDPKRRKIYLSRFMARRSAEGFFIQGKGPNEVQTEARAPDWISLINETHNAVHIYENALWKITHYTPKPKT